MRSINPSLNYHYSSMFLTKRVIPCTLYVVTSPMSLFPMVFLCFYLYFTPSPQTHHPLHYSISSAIASPPLPPPPPPLLLPPPPSPPLYPLSPPLLLPPPPPPPPRLYPLSLPLPHPLSTFPPPVSFPLPSAPPPLLRPSSPPLPPPPFTTTITEMATAYKIRSCDYTNGKWVPYRKGPMYNSTSCPLIKDTQNCKANGRPDSEYLYWRWKPNKCSLPKFGPNTFLQHVSNKHIAFIGDSVSKNQFDSLICMLSTASTPNPIAFYKWHFPSHNVHFSFYWSPFLVEGVQRVMTEPHYHNKIHLDRVNEKWAEHLDKMDLIVLSLGHWFDVPSIYYEGGSIVGCLNFQHPNCTTKMDMYGPIRKALRLAINTIIERKASKGDKVDVIVRTYSPSHFEEGGWDKGGTCARSRPYMKLGRKKFRGMNAAIRKIDIQEVEIAKKKGKEFGGFRIEAMDVTKLSLLRPDGHPGAYMVPFPFANGVPKLVRNDCVHWCLPGPIDTWNEILLEMIKNWGKARD
ncbi:xyloglucan O-acetyltransferase 1-like [Arachis stenosperma]|uniref:xyloglucan O-acetyltransferase 1-like n=1 Tax=Arachis stenosperma TaxID=217475 RepID=UPI0025AD67A9|nr:xyloglucan O-acetyltransferase 1-like [Arachis stenosperma]